jgi:putative restriction endonuclease
MDFCCERMFTGCMTVHITGGYLSVDADLRLRVSPQLRDHGWNGVEFYQREAEGFRIPEPYDAEQRPNREALAWHFETKFRAA